jgi:addiction module HigA family antidote
MNRLGWDWHALKGGLSKHWSVSVNGNWRLTFSFENGDAVLVDYQDYHWGDYEFYVQPPHPGLTLRDDTLPALNLQINEAASQLGVDRTTLSKVLNGRAAISPAMALRIERWLGRDHGGAAEVWLAQQAAYDLWQARATVKASKALSSVKAIRFQSA